jgi:hypothetical protein
MALEGAMATPAKLIACFFLILGIVSGMELEMQTVTKCLYMDINNNVSRLRGSKIVGGCVCSTVSLPTTHNESHAELGTAVQEHHIVGSLWSYVPIFNCCCHAVVHLWWRGFGLHMLGMRLRQATLSPRFPLPPHPLCFHMDAMCTLLPCEGFGGG